jgi:hypothetical protein
MQWEEAQRGIGGLRYRARPWPDLSGQQCDRGTRGRAGKPRAGQLALRIAEQSPRWRQSTSAHGSTLPEPGALGLPARYSRPENCCNLLSDRA